MRIGLNRHKVLQWLERELCAVLAILIVAAGVFWAQAGTSELVTTTLDILPPAGTIQLNTPNGGESWEVGTSQTIRWLAGAGVTNVKIELQRTTGGSWETIEATVPATDKSYPWTVTGPATSTAIVKISDTTDPLIFDMSEAVFEITITVVPPVVPPTSGGGGGVPQIVINDVNPNTAVNRADTIVDVTGSNFDMSVGVRLNKTDIKKVQWFNSQHLQFIVPAGFPVGFYSLTVHDNAGKYAIWNSLFRVVDTGPVQPMPNIFYSSRLSGQSDTKLTLTVGQEATVWIEFLNDGTLPWTNFGKNPVRLGTASPRDRLSKFKATWFSGWVLKNRPANVSRPDQKPGGRQTINPGELGRFTFTIKAPNRPGKYIENFGTVAEFIQWMPGTAKLEITVVPKQAKAPVTKKPTTSQPTVTQPKVTLPALNLPEAPTEFYDGVESWLRSFANFFTRLLGGFGRV